MKILKRIVTAALIAVTLLAMLGCTRNEPAQKVDIANLVSQQRAFLYDANLEAESRELVQEIMKHRIALTGLTDEGFWQSDEVMKGYSNSLYISKLMQEILADESQKGMDGFKQLQEKLLKAFLEKYEVNMSVLKQI